MLTTAGQQIATNANANNNKNVWGTVIYNVKVYGAKGDGTTDDSADAQEAIDTANAAGGGIVFFPEGTYLVGDLKLYSNVNIWGTGWGSIIKQKTSSSYCMSINPGSDGTSSVTNNIKNVRISDVQILGTVETDGFSEQKHLLNFNAASDVVVERCLIKGFRGDGIYIGSSNTTATERHNTNITIRDCHFDGINNDNRNGISVVDCDGLLIENCLFENTTRSTMPGAIDIEPNSNAFHIVKNITIRKIRCNNIGGNTGVINLNLPLAQSAMTTPMNYLIVEDIEIATTLNTQSGISLQQANASAIADTTSNNNIIIRDIKIKNVASRPFLIQGVKKVVIENLTCDGAPSTAIVGFTTTATKSMDIDLIGLNLIRCGSTDGKGLSIFNAERIKVFRSIFYDCGTGTASYAIDFNTGTSAYVELNDITILSPTSKTTTAIQKEAAHTFTPASNRMYNIKLIGVSGNNFQAYLTDTNYASNSYDTTVLPDSFPNGISISVANGDTNLPSATKQGLLKTEKYSENTSFRKWIIQWYYAANNDATSLADVYFRKASTAANTWSAWKKVTGV